MKRAVEKERSGAVVEERERESCSTDWPPARKMQRYATRQASARLALQSSHGLNTAITFIRTELDQAGLVCSVRCVFNFFFALIGMHWGQNPG